MITLMDGKSHTVIKRDGRTEPFSEEKLHKVLMWAAENNEIMVEEILKSVKLKIYDKIQITKLYNEVLNTVENMISKEFPLADTVARNLLILKQYKELWGMKRDKYPFYGDVLKKGVKYKVYDKEVVNSFSEQEIIELNSYIVQERDFDINYLGLRVFFDKQAKRYTRKRILELPQHGFMRLAMFAFWKEPKDVRMALIKERYDDVSQHEFSEATPKFKNSLSYNPQMSSCVVSKMPDNSRGINKTNSNLFLYSKHSGGLATDITSVRASNSLIGTTGTSSGPIPFIKLTEAGVKAYNQDGTRPGACAVYFSLWHYDAPDMLELKEEGGTEDRRARGLMYGVKINKLFLERALNDQEMTLFDPKEVPLLEETTGEAFNTLYEEYEKKQGIMKKTVNALDYLFELVKQRFETGNIYIFLEENVEKQNNFNHKIYSSNLCNEIYLPTKAVEFKDFELSENMSTDEVTLTEEYEPGYIALCNLSSINLMRWFYHDDEKRERIAYNLLRASDNLIDYAFYPTKEGERFNKEFRAIGVGVTNLAQLLAKNTLKWGGEDTLQFVNDVMESVYYHLMKASIRLAKERGRFKKFNETKYKDGKFTFELFAGDVEYPLNYDWETLRQDLLACGARFSTVMAIAPTATSSLIMNSTEGTEPLHALSAMKDGTYTCPQLAPNVATLGHKYELAFDIDSNDILTNAAVRQRWLDQGQSVTLYYIPEKTTAFDLLRDILTADRLGMKGLYYAKSTKNDEVECESCKV